MRTLLEGMQVKSQLSKLGTRYLGRAKGTKKQLVERLVQRLKGAQTEEEVLHVAGPPKKRRKKNRQGHRD